MGLLNIVIAKLWPGPGSEDRRMLNQLKRELNRKKVPDYLYNLGGKGRCDERLVITRLDDGRWEVYYKERGVKTTDVFFDKPEDACRYMISELSDME